MWNGSNGAAQGQNYYRNCSRENQGASGDSTCKTGIGKKGRSVQTGLIYKRRRIYLKLLYFLIEHRGYVECKGGFILAP